MHAADGDRRLAPIEGDVTVTVETSPAASATSGGERFEPLDGGAAGFAR